MRILHISTKVKDNFCGVSTVVDKLFEYQSQSNGVVLELEYIEEKDVLFKFLYLLKKLNKSDVVVFHKVFSPLSWVLMAFCLLIRIDYCVHLHGAFMPNAMRKSYYKKYYKEDFLNYLISKVLVCFC
ncbi:hypothetical protein [Vibrio celticus]|uniref:hypothetical protein n=1 Tax=Vibrio celticus TaxID=446372 RepID=UPI0021C2CA65|nr:hypothetical protein [Vibrio celticus]